MRLWCQMTQWNGKIICNRKKCEMNLITVILFFYKGYFFSNAFFRLIHVDVWWSHVASLSSLSHLLLLRCFLLLFSVHLILALYLFFRQCWDIFMLCAMFILFMMRVYFIYSIFPVWRSTNTNCEYFMNGKSSFRTKLFLWFNSQIICKQVCACDCAYLFLYTFILSRKWMSFQNHIVCFLDSNFSLLLNFICVLEQFFFSSFNLEK